VSFVLPCFARATNEHSTKPPSTEQCFSCRAKAPLRYAFGCSTTSPFGADSLNHEFFWYALFVLHRQNRIRVTSRNGADVLPQAGKYYSSSSFKQIRELRVGAQDAQRAAAEPERTCCLLRRLVQRRASCRAAPEKGLFDIRKGRYFLCHARGLSVQLESRVEVYCRVL